MVSCEAVDAGGRAADLLDERGEEVVVFDRVVGEDLAGVAVEIRAERTEAAAVRSYS